MQIKVDAKLIFTLSPKMSKSAEQYKDVVVLAAEQVINNLGVVNHESDLVDTGQICFGIRCHIKDESTSSGNSFDEMVDDITDARNERITRVHEIIDKRDSEGNSEHEQMKKAVFKSSDEKKD
jgi:hypothetical protein